MKNNKIYIIVATAILTIGFLIFSLEKLQVTNFYVKPVPAVVNTPRPVNSVDYTPQTSPPDPTVNSEKNPAESSPSTPSPSNATVSITRANQDPSTKNLNIGVLVYGTSTGTCTLELLQGTYSVITKIAAVTAQSGLVTCSGFTLLASDIPSAGTYSVKVSVGSASAVQNVELAK